MLIEKKISQQSGLSLIEILVALAIGMFLLLGLSSFMLNNLNTQSSNIKAITLNQDLRQAAMLISRDLKRAGFSASLTTNSFNTIRICQAADTNNPCTSMTTPKNEANHCALYTYDRNKDGGAPSVDEYTGIKLTSSKLYLRTQGNGTSNCEANSNNTWVQLTDDKIKVTKLQFCYIDATSNTNASKLPPETCNNLPTGGQRINNLAIYVEGELTSDATVKSKYIEVIRLYNAPINAS